MTIIKLCAKCKKPIPYHARYCSKCSEIYEKESVNNKRISNKKYYYKRDKKYLRFYKSKEWNLLKNKRLQNSGYMCERCRKLGKNNVLATEVHHIKPIQTDEGWKLRLDYNNTIAVCLDCHNHYHNRFQRRNKNETKTNSY